MSTKKPLDEKISNIPPFGLRMMPELKERISQAAEATGRSMNAEIVVRLESSFEKPTPPLSDLVKDFAETMEKDPLVAQEDLNRLWALYDGCRKAEWENVRTFTNAVSEIIQRVTSERGRTSQTGFIALHGRKDREGK